MLYVYGKASTQHYKSKKVLKYFRENKDALIPHISSYCITRVYDNGRNMEYLQMRSACPKILSIICKFKE